MRGLREHHPTGRRAPAPFTTLASALVAAALVFLAGWSAPAAAQSPDPVLEALRQHRQAIRTAQLLAEMRGQAAAHGPAEIPLDFSERRRVLSSWPLVRLPELTLPPMGLDRSSSGDEAPGPVELTELTWMKVAPGEERPYMYRFAEVLWTNAGRLAATPLDTMATPEVRARLNTLYGMPTRTAAAQSRSDQPAGSPHGQFEYWFAVNDSIPVVAMDRAGPFGYGIVLLSDEAYVGVLATVVEDLARQLATVTLFMPYVDYYEAREQEKWYRTGYDGTRFYVLEIDRPAWARRPTDGGYWFDFR